MSRNLYRNFNRFFPNAKKKKKKKKNTSRNTKLRGSGRPYFGDYIHVKFKSFQPVVLI